MPRLSIEVSDHLYKRLQQHLIDHYGRTHGLMQDLVREAITAYLDREESPIPTEILSQIRQKPPIAKQPALVKKIWEMYDSGISQTEIAKEIGYVKQTVNNFIMNNKDKR